MPFTGRGKAQQLTVDSATGRPHGLDACALVAVVT